MLLDTNNYVPSCARVLKSRDTYSDGRFSAIIYLHKRKKRQTQKNVIVNIQVVWFNVYVHVSDLDSYSLYRKL